MRASHGWAEIDGARKREIIKAISSGGATRGPVHAELDITDRCNVACYFCNQQDVRTKEQVSLAHLVRLIDELAEGGLRSVRLSGGGDPLFHSAILEVLDHLHRRGIVIDNLTTNGVLLGPEVARRLVEHHAREVIFSLNAVDQDDYHRMMAAQPRTFHRVVESVQGLVRARGGSSYPGIVIQFLIDRKNYHELPRMYDLGRSLGADRIAVSVVLEIPLQRIDASVLLVPEDGETLRPFLEEILRRDKDAHLLQLFFPVAEWNVLVEQLKTELSYGPEKPLVSTAPSFREKNGHCFFGWYTATIRGNGDLYPCCLLMSPDYKPLGNALNGHFVDHWNGPAFERMRFEQREVLMAGDQAAFDPSRFQILRRQCVEPGLCWLKNMYFRGDEKFYGELAQALEKARRPWRLKKRAAGLARRIRKVARRARDLARPVVRSADGVRPRA
jgi:MoaA/NifB/PqqE/SkfB family radical SAM enzyme